MSEIKGNFDLMKKAFSKLWQHFKKHIEQVAQRVRALSSKLRKYFKEHIDEILTRVVFLLGALGVVVMFSDGTAIYLQQLLGLSEESEKLREKYGVLKVIGFCIVGVLLILQALAANKRAKAMEDATENTEDGQRQERLKNAIEHLGHKRDSVRMGGAYELFHLAKDTKDLRQTVLDILCAHIRQTTHGNTYQAEHKTKPSEEIQSLLTLLFIEEHDVFEGCSINLQGSYLNGATLIQARLKKANLFKARLQGAKLMAARVQRANLGAAQMQGADLSATQMQGAGLMAARVQGAVLRVAQLQGAFLREAQLQGADLMVARLQGANLLAVQMQGADLRATQMQGAFLREAQLQGADLGLAQMQEADLAAARLQGVSGQETYYLPSARFESKIRNRIDRPSDLKGIFFADGLREENLDAICGALSAGQAQALREKLILHVGKPASNELPKNSSAKTGAYTQEEAEQWIAEYNKAMEGVPRTDDTADAASTPDNDKGKRDRRTTG